MRQYRKLIIITKTVTQLHSLTVLLLFCSIYLAHIIILPHSEPIITRVHSNNYDFLAIRIFCTSLIFTLIDYYLTCDIISFSQEFRELWSSLDVVVDGGVISHGGRGEASRLGSTVVDLSHTGSFSIIRPGMCVGTFIHAFVHCA